MSFRKPQGDEATQNMNPFDDTPARETAPEENQQQNDTAVPNEDSAGSDTSSGPADGESTGTSEAAASVQSQESSDGVEVAPHTEPGAEPDLVGLETADVPDVDAGDGDGAHSEIAPDPEFMAAAEDVPVVDAGEDAAPSATPVSAEDNVEDSGEQDLGEEQLPGYEDNPNMNWFIVHTYSGFENKVSESLRTRAEAFGFADRLGQILIPTEEVVEMRNGKKITSKRLLYPGYVLVQMEMDDDLWHQVKNTPRVTGFIGGGGKPVPLSASEVNSILFRQSTAAERPRPKLNFEKNETVRIVDGPFANFSGKVDEINLERNTLRVMVTIFGRSTPVELDFLQVEKIA
jgi:transcription termination/antitermination protein NusG